MAASEMFNREIIVVQRDSTILEVAKLMRQYHVGDVTVIEDHSGVQVPVGVVTERDLVVEIMAPELDYMVFTVGDIIDLHAV